MAITKLFSDVDDYIKWGVTTKQAFSELIRNMFSSIKNTLDSQRLWQPETDYNLNEIIASPSLPPNCVAKVIQAGVSGKAEPSWSTVGTKTSDGTVIYSIQYKVLDRATLDEVDNGNDIYKYITPKILNLCLAKKTDDTAITPSFLLKKASPYNVNYLPDGNSAIAWYRLGFCMIRYTKTVLSGQPSKGVLLNIPNYGSTYSVAQLFLSEVSSHTGDLYYRILGGDSTDTGFVKLAINEQLQETNAMLLQNYSKLLDAYNDLKKRSYPTEFDTDELTVLMDTAIGSGTIKLSQPYTDFDGLLFENTNDDRNKLNRTYISVAEFNARMARAKEIKPTAPTMNLLTNPWEWSIWLSESRGFSSTSFPVYAENCVMERVYGVKFKLLTLGGEEDE